MAQIDYKVVGAWDIGELVTKVKFLQLQGWVTTGGFIYNVQNGAMIDGERYYYFQAMVKNK